MSKILFVTMQNLRLGCLGLEACIKSAGWPFADFHNEVTLSNQRM